MQIVDLTPEHHHACFHCLEPEEEDILDGVERKRAWYEQMRDRGLIVKLAIDDDGKAAGMVQVLPIEQSQAVGERLHFVLCIWVHGHRKGIGNR